MATDDDERREATFFASRGFGLTMGFGEAPALMVVDFINAFTDPGQMLGAKLDDELDATNKLLAAAHERAVPVFFSTVSYDDEDFCEVPW
jgi:maleamate amidohydrolase